MSAYQQKLHNREVEILPIHKAIFFFQMGKDHQNKLFQNSKLTKGLKQSMGTLIQKKKKRKKKKKKWVLGKNSEVVAYPSPISHTPVQWNE